MMTEQELEGNKLIAEFMGYAYHPHMVGETVPGWRKEKAHPKISGTYLGRAHKDLAYHRSWEWLMTAVEKIENWNSPSGFDRINVTITEKSCRIEKTDMVIFHRGKSKIQSTFGAVCEFIQKFNKEIEELNQSENENTGTL